MSFETIPPHLLQSDSESENEEENINKDLLDAIHSRNRVRVRKLLAEGASLEFFPVTDDKPAIVMAALQADPPMIQMLLDAGASLDFPDKWGMTSWMKILRNKNVPLQNLIAIINSRHSVDLYGSSRQSPMLRAAETGNEELMLQLLYRMITIHTNTNQNELTIAASNGCARVVEWILKNSTDLIDSADVTGTTSLMFAIQRKYWAVVKSLISYGADIELKNGIGKSALVYAEESKIPNLSTILSNRDLDELDKLIPKPPPRPVLSSFSPSTGIGGLFGNGFGKAFGGGFGAVSTNPSSSSFLNSAGFPKAPVTSIPLSTTTRNVPGSLFGSHNKVDDTNKGDLEISKKPRID